MAGAIPSNPTAHNVAALLPKLHDPDSDFRYMSLNDLYNTLNAGHQGFLLNDQATCGRTVDGILKTLDDQNGEVQNLAVKCLGPLVLKVPADILPPLIERLTSLTTHNAVDNSIPSTALRTVVASFPRPTPGIPPSKACLEAYSAISRVLIPRLVGYTVMQHGTKNVPAPSRGMLQPDPEKGVDSDAIDVLTEVARCFGPILQEPEVRALQKALTAILEDERTGSVVKKKTIVAISTLAAYFSDGLLSSFVSNLIESFRSVHLTVAKRRLLITMTGSLARSIPQRFGPYLKVVTPFILSVLSQQELEEASEDAAENGEVNPELEELREAALVALESFLASCSNDMRAYTQDCIDAALRYVKYDPNVAEERDEQMGGTQSGEEDDGETNNVDDELDEDFEEEEGLSDDDDVSWKVRRCAAKVLYTIISTRGNGDLLDDGTLYQRVAPVLVSRFQEREENVRLEIMTTLDSLVRKTGESLDVSATTFGEANAHFIANIPQSRKRRRGGSDASIFDAQTTVSRPAGVASPVTPPSPMSGPRADLAKLSPILLDGIAKLLKGSSSATKQAAVSLTKHVVQVQRGGLSNFINQFIGPIVDAIQLTNTHGSIPAVAIGPGGSATGSTLRTEALALVSAVVQTHPSTILLPYFDRLVPAVVSAVKDNYYKVSIEALGAAEQLAKALTSARSSFPDQKQQPHLRSLYMTVLDRVTAGDADAEVRQRAIHTLGIILARSSGTEGAKLISTSNRLAALDVLRDRLNNETTRLSAVRAIDTVAALAQEKKDFEQTWVQNVALQLGGQLRKADRSLRGASLGALKNLVVNPASRAHLDDKTTLALVDVLSPVLSANDLHLLGLALVVLEKLVRLNPGKVVNDELNSALCTVVMVPLSGAVSDVFLVLLRTIGEQGVGKPLMQRLLQDVGVTGDPNGVGKAIGALLVSGGASVGVKIEDFVGELQSAPDDQRKCLALAVLGEVGLRMGEAFPLKPSMFLSHFNSKSDHVPLAAAVALGRAGAGNVGSYLPVIVTAMKDGNTSQYLLLHSIKEILRSGNTHASITHVSQQLWEKLLAASQTEDNRAVGAECLGRLAMIEPKTYLPLLKDYLRNPNPTVRGMVIQAMRYTFADSDESFDHALKPVIVGALTTMMNDVDLENRRLALTALNAATHSKPEIILPHLSQLLPLVMKESVVRPELVREVQMGPFKHKVDDGLEVRKSAYETLYALLENASSRINIIDFFDRVIAGLGDEHDIRVLCNLMLTKLIVLNAEETQRRLDAVAERFRAIMSFKPKENAVKQEVEKAEEASKGVLRVSVQLNNAFPAAAGSGASGQHQTWKSYWEWLKKDYSSRINAIEQDLRSQGI